MRIVLTGGGSGGHFYPLIATAEAIRDRDQALTVQTELFYIGPEEYNRDALARLNISFRYCPAGKRRRYVSILNVFDTFKMLFGILVAIVKLYSIYPDVVFSKGSYTSVPVTIAAKLLMIPIVIHESDAVPGKANKLAAKSARYIGISYDDTAEHFPAEKVALTGVPIRKIFFAQRPDAASTLGVPTTHPIIFITGGSLGAERLNNFILDSLDELLPKYTLIHQVGEANADTHSKTAGSILTDLTLLERYFVYGSMSGEQMAAAQQAASLIISRAGSGSIAEIALNQKPSILIPIPEDVSHDQRANAYAYARTGAATVIEEKNLSDDLIEVEVAKILDNKDQYKAMQAAAANFTHPGAAYTLADTLLGIGGEHL